MTGTWATGYSEDNCNNFYDLSAQSASDPAASGYAPKGKCGENIDGEYACTQQTTGICSGTFLAAVLMGPGMKYAFCNDKWLVLGITGEPHWAPNLNDVANPPKVEVDGVTYRSGNLTQTLSDKETNVYIPLNPVLHAAGGKYSNNLGLYDGTSAISNNNGPVSTEGASLSLSSRIKLRALRR